MIRRAFRMSNPINQPNPISQPSQQPASHMQSSQPSQPMQRAHPTPQHLLAEWIIEAEQDSSGEKLWQLFSSRPFARLWYDARSAGETLRSWAIEHLYQHRPHPGGPHPDPREPAAFSSQAIIAAAAQQLGVRIWQVPALVAAAETAAETSQPLAWIISYAGGTPPEIAVRYTSHLRQREFDMACLIGYICKEKARLADPDAPGGTIFPPTDSAIQTILHQFAIGFLCLPRDCPASWSCACNQIRARFNAPPADHQQPTDSLPIKAVQQTQQSNSFLSQKPEDSQPDQPINSGPLTR